MNTYVIAAQDVPIVNGFAENIHDTEGSNTLQFSSGGPASVTTTLDNGALQLRFDTGHAMLLQDGLLGGIASVQDGSKGPISFASWLQSHLTTRVTVVGTAAHQTLLGGSAGDDLGSLLLGARFDGGQGDDLLSGSGGNNTYVFGMGSGHDRIIDTSAKTDGAGAATPNRVLFGAGITGAGLVLTQNGSLMIQVGAGGADTIRIDGFTANNASAFNAIDSFEFDDGSTLNYAQLLARGFDYTGSAGAETITGTDQADRFALSAGNDALNGGLGSDTYAFGLGAGQDVVQDGDAGASATDTVTVGAGLLPQDVVLNQIGNDLVLRTRISADTLTVVGHFTGTSIERIVFDGGLTWSAIDIAAHVTNELTEGNDNYTGTGSADFIDAKGGDDIVRGMGGDDTIDGGSGNDQLYGGDGNDRLLGGAGTNSLYGENGDDTLEGGSGYDYLSGAAGNDILLGNDGNDQLDGSTGDDLLDGGSGTDTMWGGDGNDTLRNGETMYGGLGSDTYVVGAASDSTIYESTDASAHTDVLVLPAVSTPAGLEVRRWMNSSTGWYDDLVLRDSASHANVLAPRYFYSQDGDSKIELIQFGNGVGWTVADVMANDADFRATQGDDTIYGHRWNDVVDALDGGDMVFGGAGNDTLRGGNGGDFLYGDDSYAPTRWIEGDDTLDGGAGKDWLFGGGGNDAYVFDRGYGTDRISETGGTDKILLGTGVLPTDVTLFRQGSDLILVLDASSTQLTIGQQFYAASNAIESIQFANGVVWDSATIAANTVSGAANAMVGTAGDDTFVVDNAGDSITEGVNQGHGHGTEFDLIRARRQPGEPDADGLFELLRVREQPEQCAHRESRRQHPDGGRWG